MNQNSPIQKNKCDSIRVHLLNMWRKNVELQRTQSGLLPYDELPVDYNFNETKRNDTEYSLPSTQSTVSFVSSNPCSVIV